MPSIKILDAASVTTFVETFQNASGTTLMASVPINSAGTAIAGLTDAADGLPVFIVGGTATIALTGGTASVALTGGTTTISGALPAGTNALGTVSALQSGVWTALLSGGTTTISGALPAGTNALGTVSALQSGIWTALLSGGTTTISGALPAGSNAIGTVSALQSGAWTITSNVATASMLRGGTTSGTTSAVTIIASQGATTAIYITSLQFGNTNTAVFTVVTLNDGAATPFMVPSGVTVPMVFPTPLRVAANTALTFTLSTAVATVYAAAQGYGAA